jgi:iron complex outermembrane receptor protein
MRTFDVPQLRAAQGLHPFIRQKFHWELDQAAPSTANASHAPESAPMNDRPHMTEARNAMLVVCLLPILLVAFAEPAIAQESAVGDDPFAGVEEMIVTGDGKAELLAPSNTQAISFDSGDLEAYGVEDIGDIAAQVPNLEIRSANSTNASFFVRGVGLQDFGANASSSVPIFQDGVPRNPSATQLTGLYDISGLSVLKGPQGSGNFRNASAGAFLVLTAKPEPEFSGFAKTTIKRIVSVDAHDANSYNMEMGMNIPVYEDIISARISARYSHDNPFFENGCANRQAFSARPVYVGRRDLNNGLFSPDVSARAVLSVDEARLCGETFNRRDPTGLVRTGISPVSPFLKKYLGEVDDYGARVQFRIQPPDSGMDWVFRAELSRLNQDSNVGQVFGTARGLGGFDSSQYRDSDIQARYDQIEPRIRAANPGGSVATIRSLTNQIIGRELLLTPLDEHPYRGDFDRPGKTLRDTHEASTTGLIELEDINIEINAGYLDYRLSAVTDTDLSPNVRFPSKGNNQAWEVYGDFAVSGEAIGDIPLMWDVGAYSLIENVESTQQQQVFETVRVNTFTQEIYSFGLFAEGEYEFLEAFTLSGGIRYNWERKDFTVQTDRLPQPGSPSQQVFSGGSENQRTWDALTGFLNVRYDFTEEIGAYMKYTRGFKAGHFNPSRPLDAKVPGKGYADPEQIDSFEVGVDFSVWDSRISGAGAFFFYNYTNYQVFRLTTTQEGVFRSIENAKKARNYGAEVEISITPLEGFAPEAIEGLRINLRGAVLETNFVNFAVAESRSLGSVGVIGVPINYSGNPLLNAPNLSVSGTISWPLMMGRYGTLTPQYDFSWSDDVPFDPNNGRGEVGVTGESVFPNYLVGNRAYILHNVRLKWDPPGGEGQFSVAGWCRNLADQRYKTFSVDLNTFAQSQLIYVGAPRTCGADVRLNF